MKRTRNNFIRICLLGLFTNLVAADIELNRDFYEFDIIADKMVVIDFPFPITDKSFLGNKENIEGDMKEKSIYLKLKTGSVDLSIWGGEKPILITLNARDNGNRRISFYSKTNEVEKSKKDYKEWNHDIKVAEQIETYSKKGVLSGYDKTELNGEFNIDDEITLLRVERLTNAGNYAFEKYIVVNTSNKQIDLFEKKEIYFTTRDEYAVDALSADERYIVPGQNTIVYLGLEKAKK